MNVGLTYDLRSDYLKMGYSMEETAEFDKEDTIVALDEAIRNAGFQTVRIGNYRSLMTRLLNGETWDMVFNICEGMFGDGRESLVPALLDQYRIPYVFSGPATLALSLNKYLTKRIVREVGVPTPDFILVKHPADLNKEKPAYPVFVKPVSEGTGKGISKQSMIDNDEDYKKVCLQLLSTFNQPVLVEKYLPGREFTIGVVGTSPDARVIGGMELKYYDQKQGIYSYETKENWQKLLTYDVISGDLLKEGTAIVLAAWEAIDGLDGGRIDLKADENGKLHFIEVNPLAGLNPDHSDLPILARMNGISYQDLITQILESATRRIFKYA